MTQLPIAASDDMGLDTIRASSRRGFAASARADKPDSTGWTVRCSIQSAAWRTYVAPSLDITKLRGRTVLWARLTQTTVNGWAANNTTAVRATSDWTPETIRWSKQPTTGTTQVVTAIPGYDAGTRFGLNVRTLLQEIADGAEYFGFCLTTDYATGPLAMWGFDSGKPAFTLEYATSDAPETPTRLTPSGGSWVGTKTPTLTAQYADADGTPMAGLRVQLSPTAKPANLAHDSGWINSRRPRYDTTGTSWVGLINSGDTISWRIRVRDQDGNESDWSDWALFGYRPLPNLTPTSPATGVTVIYDPTPILAATVNGSATITSQRVIVTRGADRSIVLYDTGERDPYAAQQIQAQVPLRNDQNQRILEDGKTYQANFRGWPDQDRDWVPGSPVYSSLWVTFTVNDDLAATAPVLADVQQPGGALSPKQRLSWTYPAIPDGGWVICRNGQAIERLASGDVDSPSSGQYRYTLKQLARPNTLNTYTVKAVVNGKQSKPSNEKTAQYDLMGVWLMPLDSTDGTDGVMLRGLGVDDWGRTDRRAVYSLLSGRTVDVLDGQGLNSGTFDGWLHAEPTVSITKALAEQRLTTMRNNPMDPVWLLGGDFRALVLLRGLSFDTPMPDTIPGMPRSKASFGWVQVNPDRYTTT